MKVIYKKWESGQGFEEMQAKIYNQVSGLPARAEEIGPRNNHRGKEATRYALKDDGKPLAYITSEILHGEPGRAHIGYPWSLPECPADVKDKLFDDLLNYLYSIDGIMQIRTAVVKASKTMKAQTEYFLDRGFIENERHYRYNLDMDVVETASREIIEETASLTARAATEKDIAALVELSNLDPYLRYEFPNEEGFVTYFKDRVLKDGHCIILYDQERPVMATAPLRFKPDGNFLKGDEDRYIMRFTASRPGYEYAWDRLVIELAKECNRAGLTDFPIRASFGYRASGPTAIGIAGLQSNIELVEIFYVHNRK
jgi:hypothetical protein